MKNNSIIKSSTFCLKQNRLTELTPKAPFDASFGIPLKLAWNSHLSLGLAKIIDVEIERTTQHNIFGEIFIYFHKLFWSSDTLRIRFSSNTKRSDNSYLKSQPDDDKVNGVSAQFLLAGFQFPWALNSERSTWNLIEKDIYFFITLGYLSDPWKT